jgi:hypothetical protein
MRLETLRLYYALLGLSHTTRSTRGFDFGGAKSRLSRWNLSLGSYKKHFETRPLNKKIFVFGQI